MRPSDGKQECNESLITGTRFVVRVAWSLLPVQGYLDGYVKAVQISAVGKGMGGHVGGECRFADKHHNATRKKRRKAAENRTFAILSFGKSLIDLPAVWANICFGLLESECIFCMAKKAIWIQSCRCIRADIEGQSGKKLVSHLVQWNRLIARGCNRVSSRGI